MRLDGGRVVVLSASGVCALGKFMVTYMATGGVTLTDGPSKDSRRLSGVSTGDEVEIVELRHIADEQRVRARLREGGWITVAGVDHRVGSSSEWGRSAALSFQVGDKVQYRNDWGKARTRPDALTSPPASLRARLSMPPTRDGRW